MTVEQLLNSVKTVVDYERIFNGTVFAVVRSDEGNYSIRQSFRNAYGDQNGFKVVKMLGKIDDELAKIELADMVAKVNEYLARRFAV